MAAHDAALATPVALLLYNRPAETQATFAAIRAARPARLFLVADGPRAVAGDDARCAAARAAVAEVDWPCAVERIFAARNLGCGRRVASGLDHVFAAVDEAVILEDDCLPGPDFFRFCTDLLARHRDDERVMMVSGSNPLDTWGDGRQSYHFARYGSIWGWATWRRAWRHYDYAMRGWADPAVRAHVRARLADDEQFAFVARSFQRVVDGRTDTWDHQWQFARLASDGVAAVPAQNLVVNHGFGAQATHTRRRSLLHAVQRHGRLAFPLIPPASPEPDAAYDRRYHEFHSGRFSAESVAAVARGLLARGRRVQALACLRAGAARHPGDATLAALMRETLGRLGRPG